MVAGEHQGRKSIDTDILLAGSLQLEAEAISLTGDIVVPTVRASAEYASQHGVLVQCKDGSVSNILYQPSAEQLQADQVDVISGLVWFQPPVAESLIKLYSLSPIDGCTYMGADSGEAALQMSLLNTSFCAEPSLQDNRNA